MVFSLYNPAIVYGNLELAPPIEHQLVRHYLTFQLNANTLKAVQQPDMVNWQNNP